MNVPACHTTRSSISTRPNSEFSQADVALIMWANDVVNTSAGTDKVSPIYGMPILNATWRTAGNFQLRLVRNRYSLNFYGSVPKNRGLFRDSLIEFHNNTRNAFSPSWT
ncbi:MAG: hypothetical protein CVU18_05335 [Betaproteobacteria bacterium HGW-Betaproteobacteria-12]|nr:MAG: hypothetical protein CVU18_05335 [Betaproteobacteria bacterium HGW-Betaproteobacteria-12]